MGTKNILFAAVGAGDLALEKVREVDRSKIRQISRQRLSEVQEILESAGAKALTDGATFYKGLVKRGENTLKGVGNSAPYKRAIAQTKTARSQTKAAVTSSRKAAATTVEAVKEAASSV